MGDYYTLDDMFESSSASKTSRAEKDERAKKRAIAGILLKFAVDFFS